MKLINQSAELIKQPEGIKGIYKHIERCARTCYKSEDKITEDSAEKFVQRLIDSKHTAMLEHATVYLGFFWPGAVCDVCNQTKPHKLLDRYCQNPYCKVTYHDNNVYVTTNYRVLIENNWLDNLDSHGLTDFHTERYTMKFVTSRGIANELLRHRAFSFAQESQRFCNYSKDKFNNELTFIYPHRSYIKTAVYANRIPYNGVPQYDGDYFEEHLREAENTYFKLIKDFNWAPQEARDVLPNATKTEIIMTGFLSDWEHFFDLRLGGTTGKPHPDMKVLAQLAKDEFNKYGIII